MIKYYLVLLSCLFCLTAQASVEVSDYLNRNVSLPVPAKRIVALAPHIVENLYSAGAGDLIVGAVDYCDYPKAAMSIPRVGGISSFSIEKIVSLKPDLVIVWRSGRGGQVQEKLEKLGLNVYASDPRELTDVARSIRDYGVLANTQKTAQYAAQKFEQRYLNIKQSYGALDAVKTLYQVWNDPIQTLNGKHIISDVIRLCGGVNVFESALALAPKISIESVIRQNPEVIIASGMGQERPDWLNTWQRWQDIHAVAQKNLYFVPPDIIQRHTVRILDGAVLMCEHLASARSKRQLSLHKDIKIGDLERLSWH